MRIDLPTCGFKNCRHCFDGNCNSRLEYSRCEYRDLKEGKGVDLAIVSPECGDWEALYINGKLIDENHRLRIEKVLNYLGQFLPISLVRINVSDEIAEMGMPQNLSELTTASASREGTTQ